MQRAVITCRCHPLEPFLAAALHKNRNKLKQQGVYLFKEIFAQRPILYRQIAPPKLALYQAESIALLLKKNRDINEAKALFWGAEHLNTDFAGVRAIKAAFPESTLTTYFFLPDYHALYEFSARFAIQGWAQHRLPNAWPDIWFDKAIRNTLLPHEYVDTLHSFLSDEQLRVVPVSPSPESLMTPLMEVGEQLGLTPGQMKEGVEDVCLGGRDVLQFVTLLMGVFERTGSLTVDWFHERKLRESGRNFSSILSPAQHKRIEAHFARSHERLQRQGYAVPECRRPEERNWRAITPLEPAEVAFFMETLRDETADKIKAYLHSLDKSALCSHELHSLRGFLKKPQVTVGEDLARPKVSVLTTAFNHAPYIEKCINGVIAQQTSFPIEHIIVDDRSYDGTADIIRSYAEQFGHIVPIYLKENTWGSGSHYAMFDKARAPYVALCDGDDYFSNKFKLQLQASLLDDNPNYALCFHPVTVTNANLLYTDVVFPTMLPGGPQKYYHLTDLIRSNFIQTNSVMYRWRFTEGIPNWFRVDLIPNDWYWHLLHAEKGKIGFINKVMSVYYRHPDSAYYSAAVNRVIHRVAKGLEELYLYDAINHHFNGQFEEILKSNIGEVFEDLRQYAGVSKDTKPLERAAAAFPEFFKMYGQATSQAETHN